jgi:hypothetical protein
MSGELTQFGANRAVVAGVGKAQAATSAMYVALATALPAGPDTATLASFVANEITTGGYSRQVVDWTSPTGDPSKVANDDIILFGEFSADPPEVGYAFLTDTSIGDLGNVMAYWTLDTPRDAATGDYIRFASGELTMSVD